MTTVCFLWLLHMADIVFNKRRLFLENKYKFKKLGNGSLEMNHRLRNQIIEIRLIKNSIVNSVLDGYHRKADIADKATEIIYLWKTSYQVPVSTLYVTSNASNWLSAVFRNEPKNWRISCSIFIASSSTSLSYLSNTTDKVIDMDKQSLWPGSCQMWWFPRTNFTHFM